jgi:hypothetical protein
MNSKNILATKYQFCLGFNKFSILIIAYMKIVESLVNLVIRLFLEYFI